MHAPHSFGDVGTDDTHILHDFRNWFGLPHRNRPLAREEAELFRVLPKKVQLSLSWCSSMVDNHQGPRLHGLECSPADSGPELFPDGWTLQPTLQPVCHCLPPHPQDSAPVKGKSNLLQPVPASASGRTRHCCGNFPPSARVAAGADLSTSERRHLELRCAAQPRPDQQSVTDLHVEPVVVGLDVAGLPDPVGRPRGPRRPFARRHRSGAPPRRPGRAPSTASDRS